MQVPPVPLHQAGDNQSHCLINRHKQTSFMSVCLSVRALIHPSIQPSTKSAIHTSISVWSLIRNTNFLSVQFDLLRNDFVKDLADTNVLPLSRPSFPVILLHFLQRWARKLLTFFFVDNSCISQWSDMDLPKCSPISGGPFAWADWDKNDFVQVIESPYSKAVHWRRNCFLELLERSLSQN